MKNATIALLLFFMLPILSAQPLFPDDGYLFDNEILPRVDVFVNADTLQWIYDHPDSDIEFHADFVFTHNTSKDTVKDVGFRLRGNTSRYAQKKSFKISFNTFESGRKFQNVEKMNLNGEHNDPSIMRAWLCWDLLREWNIVGARANHVKLYINNAYHGVYLNTEHIDEEFIESRFANNNGNLFKCLWPADLTYLGQNPELYKFMSSDYRVYDLKINETEDDYSDIAHFIDVLNNTPIADLPCALESVFNVDDYLKIMAADVITGNWDGYIFNKNNFYLYHNTQTGLFEFINYDLDNTMGIDWFNVDWTQRNIYHWEMDGEERPLYSRILEVDEYKKAYSFYIQQFTEHIAATDACFDRVLAKRDLIAQAVAEDPYYPMDYGYSIQDFQNSFFSQNMQHVKEGLHDYLTERNQSALAQLGSVLMPPIIKYINSNQPQMNQDWLVRCYSESVVKPDLFLVYTIDNQTTEIQMFDDGAHADELAGDGIYGVIVPAFNEVVDISYQIKAVDNGREQLKPCQPLNVTTGSSEVPPIFINEFMASNSSTIADEEGEYDDWIELYNAGTNDVSLGNLYLSDDFDEPFQWQLPDIVLPPKAFLLIWADDQTNQGELHANFKLSKGGEEIHLGMGQLGAYASVDAIVYGQQEEDISYGRITDAALNWKFFQVPTPDASNGTVAIDNAIAETIRYYPNPVQDQLYFNRPVSYAIYDLSGRLMLSSEFPESNIQTSALQSGLYILEINKIQKVKILKIN